jgi:hypothetical protein
MRILQTQGQEPTSEVLTFAKLNQNAWFNRNSFAFTREEGRQSKQDTEIGHRYLTHPKTPQPEP